MKKLIIIAALLAATQSMASHSSFMSPPDRLDVQPSQDRRDQQKMIGGQQPQPTTTQRIYTPSPDQNQTSAPTEPQTKKGNRE